MKPLWDRVAISPIEALRVTPAGVIIPESAQKKPYCGTVMAVGPGVYSDKGRLVEAGVEVGDVVLYSKFPISMVEYEDLLIMRPIDILGVLKKGG